MDTIVPLAAAYLGLVAVVRGWQLFRYLMGSL